MTNTNLMGLTLGELGEFCLSAGEQKYRGKQIFDWIYTRGASSFPEMSTLSAAFRDRLARTASIGLPECVREQTSSADGTTKFLFRLADGTNIESVLIPPRTAFRSPEAGTEEEQKRMTLCVSTQVGCSLDCAFCATASMGFQRNLTPGEIVGQVLRVKRSSGKRITNLVYMGMGEPLMNYDNVMKSIEVISTGIKIAARRITVSTAGWVPKIRQMADEGRKVKLAISLHSLDPAVRTELMPVNAKFGIDELLEAVRYYYARVKQRVTFEYVLFAGRNDRDEDLRRLIGLSKQVPCKFNIIPFHSIAATEPAGLAAALAPASRGTIDEFVRRLREAHVTVFVRSSAGEDIDAACGQLAVKTERLRAARRLGARTAAPARKHDAP